MSQDALQKQKELEQLAAAARERRSVDAFMRAAPEGVAWAVLAGVCGKLLWDSLRPPLFAADRLDHLGSQIEPRLARGEDVILDRYTLSSLAYQGASVSHEFIVAANRFARKPDLTLFLYVPVNIALERVRSRGAKLERYETASQLQAIEREYNRLVGTLASVVSIDGTRPVQDVAEQCYAALQQQLG